MDINALAKMAAEKEDQSVAKKAGDFERHVPPAGATVGRFIEYIELGKHVTMYQGKPKPSADQVMVVFELLHEKNIREIEVEGGTKKYADRLTIVMPKSQSEKSKYFKLFKAMQYGREDKTHLALMLGEAFVFDVKHNEVDKNGTKVTYANIYDSSIWHIKAPFVEDPIAGTRMDISDKIAPAFSPLKIFIWDFPTKETWDSLFIDGSRTVKEGDVEKEVSNNWVQERILSATNYGGSALEQMLNGVDNLPTEELAKEKPAETPAQAEVKQAASIPAEPKVSTSATDALAALGLQ